MDITAFISACQRGITETVEFLIKNHADVNAKTRYWNMTGLMYAVREGNTEMVELLIQNGADVNATDKDGSSPLILAANSRKVSYRTI